MNNEQVKESLGAAFPSATFDEAGEWLNMVVPSEAWRGLALRLHSSPWQYDYLFCLTCIDWKTHLTMVYHLTGTGHRHVLVVKALLDRGTAQIETVADIWRTAEFHEREVSELFGVQFLHHPDLRKLILTDDFEGYPLRKDFEDPVNMIRL